MGLSVDLVWAGESEGDFQMWSASLITFRLSRQIFSFSQRA